MEALWLSICEHIVLLASQYPILSEYSLPFLDHNLSSACPGACTSWSVAGLRVLQDATPQGKYLPKKGKSLKNSVLTVLLEECGISIKTSL